MPLRLKGSDPMRVRPLAVRMVLLATAAIVAWLRLAVTALVVGRGRRARGERNPADGHAALHHRRVGLAVELPHTARQLDRHGLGPDEGQGRDLALGAALA